MLPLPPVRIASLQLGHVARVREQQAQHVQVFGGVLELQARHVGDVAGVIATQLGFESGGETGGVEGLHAGHQQVLLATEMAEEGDLVDPGGSRRSGGWRRGCNQPGRIVA